MDGTLSAEDIEKMIPIVDPNFSIDKARRMFDAPCDFIKFLSKIESMKDDGRFVLDRLLDHIHSRISDVFWLFTEEPHTLMSENELQEMYNYSFKHESDWRTTFQLPCEMDSFVSNWSALGVPEQQGILSEAQKKLTKRLRAIFNYYDNENIGRLSREDCIEMLNVVDYDADKVDLVFNPECSFERFTYGWNLLHRSLTEDILPRLEKHLQVKLYIACVVLNFDC